MIICKYCYLLWVCNGVVCINFWYFVFGVSIVLMYDLFLEIVIVNCFWLFVVFCSS